MTRHYGVFGFGRARSERAARQLRSCEIELTALQQQHADPVRLGTATTNLDESRAALAAGDIDSSWHFLNAAQRTIVAMRTPEQRADAVRALLIEAGKLSGWRRKTIESLPKVPDGVAPEPTAIEDAMLLRDEYYENRYHRIRMQRDQLQLLVMIAIVTLTGVVVTAATSPAPIDKLPPWDWRVLLLVLMFGMLGACFSATQTTTAYASGTHIPELLSSSWTTLARTVLGGCPGFAVYAFLQANMINIVNVDTAKALAVAFVGGFSERLVIKVVEGVAGGGKPDANEGGHAR